MNNKHRAKKENLSIQTLIGHERRLWPTKFWQSFLGRAAKNPLEQGHRWQGMINGTPSNPNFPKDNAGASLIFIIRINNNNSILIRFILKFVLWIFRKTYSGGVH